MEKVRRGLGPVFPRVGGCVGADMGILPILARSSAVVMTQCLGVIRTLVTEEATKFLQPCAVANESVPEIVSDLVAEMAEQGAIGLVLSDTLTLSFEVIGLINVQRDDAVVVTGEYALGIAV